MDHLERRPEAMWRTGTQWSFRNDAKVYGSPMLDSAWQSLTGGGEEDPLVAALEELKAATVPLKVPAGAAGRPRGARGRGRQRGRAAASASVSVSALSDEEVSDAD